MKLIKLIILIALFGTNVAFGQDTTSLAKQIAEQISPLVNQRDGFYLSPALRPYYRSQNYSILAADYNYIQKDLFVRQEGNGYKALTVHSESFSKRLSGISLWGKAYYTNEQITKLSYSETSDYQLLYPYVMADTIGGTLNAETYFFSGGLAKKIGAITYGLNASFRGNQSYRAIDPRPKNIVSDIDLVLSASKAINANYAISLDLKGKKYNQDNSLSFVSELGFPLIYHDAGLGMYNELLAGTRMRAYYKGNNLGAQLNLVPFNRLGFFGQLGFDQWSFDKELPSITAPISSIAQSIVSAAAGYTAQKAQHQFLLKLNGSYTKRNGTEAKFGIVDAALSLAKISEDIRYGNEKAQFGLDAVYGYKSWFLSLNTLYLDDKEYYISPSRFANYQQLQIGLALSANKKISKISLNGMLAAQQIFNLNNSYNWGTQKVNQGIFTMLNDNFAYRTSQARVFTAGVNVYLPIKDKYNLFVKGKGQLINYSKNESGKAISFSTGFLF